MDIHYVGYLVKDLRKIITNESDNASRLGMVKDIAYAIQRAQIDDDLCLRVIMSWIFISWIYKLLSEVGYRCYETL